MLNFDADVKETTARHQCVNRFCQRLILNSTPTFCGFSRIFGAGAQVSPGPLDPPHAAWWWSGSDGRNPWRRHWAGLDQCVCLHSLHSRISPSRLVRLELAPAFRVTLSLPYLICAKFERVFFLGRLVQDLGSEEAGHSTG